MVVVHGFGLPLSALYVLGVGSVGVTNVGFGIQVFILVSEGILRMCVRRVPSRSALQRFVSPILPPSPPPPSSKISGSYLILMFRHSLATQVVSYTHSQLALFDNLFSFCYYDYFRTKHSGGW